GNGDVNSPEEAARMMHETGCLGVMIGRAAMGNPWIFSRTLHYLATGEILPGPTPTMRRETAARHYELMAQSKGEHIANREMRKHLAWYTRGLRGAAYLRGRINQGCSREFFTREFWLLLNEANNNIKDIR
ncbi:MAG: tRNA-dihydrouridine synthase, partial [Desulfotomaculaceae bacterium]